MQQNMIYITSDGIVRLVTDGILVLLYFTSDHNKQLQPLLQNEDCHYFWL